MRRLLLAVALLGVFELTGCGKKGPPEPAGPPDQISYPRSYPVPPPGPPAAVSPPAQWLFGITPSTEQPQQ
jgi:hypothetical protein